MHVPQVGDAIQPSHPLSSSSPPAFNLSQHQGLFHINAIYKLALFQESPFSSAGLFCLHTFLILQGLIQRLPLLYFCLLLSQMESLSNFL